MKKILAGGVMAVSVFGLVVPSVASAATASQPSEATKKAIATCESRVKNLSPAAGRFEIYQKAYFTKPDDLSAYPSKKGSILGGKVQNIQTAKATSGPYNKRVNYVLVNERFQGAADVASKTIYKSGDKKGKAAFNVAELNKANSSLASYNKTWGTILANTSAGFKEGYKYDKGNDYGANAFATKDTDKNIKAPNTFTVSLNKDQCQTKAGRSNVLFMAKRYYAMIRATKAAVAQDKKLAADARTEYTKISTQYKSERKTLEYKP